MGGAKEGKLIIGKHIPFVWGSTTFRNFEICGLHSLASVSGTSSRDEWFPYKTLEEAVKAYPIYFRRYQENVVTGRKLAEERKDEWHYKDAVRDLPIIVPEVEYEHAVMNPYVRLWNDSVLPLLFVKSKGECTRYNGDLVDGVCVVSFDEKRFNQWVEDGLEEPLQDVREKILE